MQDRNAESGDDSKRQRVFVSRDNLQDRLLNAFLQGVVDEEAFGAKSAEIKGQLADVEK